jgi:hypothetical protein
MKKIKLSTARKVSVRVKLISILMALGFAILGGYVLLKAVNDFFTGNYFEFKRMIELRLQFPFEIREREPEIIEVVLEYPDDIDTPLEEYICEKWGAYECRSALAIAYSESGLNEDAYNVNSDGSLDIGVFQVNSTHWDKPGCSPAELFDAKSNVDCAYTIWEASGWNPWVVYQNGAYIKHLD